MLTPHAAMLATLDIEPSLDSRGMPHVGFTPTGADEVGIDSPVSVSEEFRSSYKITSNSVKLLVRISFRSPLMGHIPERKKDCTKDN